MSFLSNRSLYTLTSVNQQCGPTVRNLAKPVRTLPALSSALELLITDWHCGCGHGFFEKLSSADEQDFVPEIARCYLCVGKLNCIVTSLV